MLMSLAEPHVRGDCNAFEFVWLQAHWQDRCFLVPVYNTFDAASLPEGPWPYVLHGVEGRPE
jgi:hypothetical protein